VRQVPVARTVILGAIVLIVACAPSPHHPKLAVRGLALSTDEMEYASQFRWHGQLVARAEDTGAYIAIVRVRRLSGGDDEVAKAFATPRLLEVPVAGGVGDFSINGGYRRKKTSFQEAETWDPAKFDVTIVGTTPVDP
jgi:hypothetical protein